MSFEHFVYPCPPLRKLSTMSFFNGGRYIFLAVAVDPYGTFCNHHTFFGLSITLPKEGEDWIAIVVFFVSLLILILLVIAGYYFRRYQVYHHFYKKAMFNHLLTAAWNLSFRYEKMLYDAKITDPEVRKEMEETRQMKNSHSGVESHAKENQTKKIDKSGIV
ncbi:unnamed protein product [Allacma fusca]|uniref:Uncharacterized protein n=1 Tax=Allacma fusca TaxID=39272 RepID=A0A8J2KVC9_9HEXA|nr:unnamed protein product [Allacma fusca]